MNWKRTIVSYAAWLLFGVLTCAIGNEMTRIVTAAWGLDKSKAGFVFAGVLLLGGLFSVLIFWAKKSWMLERQGIKRAGIKKAGIKKAGIKKAGIKKLWGWMEVAFVACLVAFGAWLRLSVFQALLPGGMYSHAIMQYAKPLPEYFYGAGDVYLHLLHGICFLLGNTPEHCIRFQFLITLIAGIVLWLGVRSVSGKVPALCVAAFYYLTPYLTQRTGVLSPEPLFFMVYGIGLLLMGVWLRGGGESLILAALAGAWIGIAVYGDLIGFTLLIFGVSVWHYDGQADGKKELAVDGSKPGKKRKWYAGLGILFACAIIGWMACLSLKSLSAGEGIGNALNLWWDQACPSAWIDLNWNAFLENWFPGFSGSKTSILLTVLLVLGIFGFFFDKSREGISAWTLTALISLGSMAFENVHVVRLFTHGSFGEPLEYPLPIPFDSAAGCIFMLSLFTLCGITVRSFFGTGAVAEEADKNIELKENTGTEEKTEPEEKADKKEKAEPEEKVGKKEKTEPEEKAGSGNLISKYLQKQAEKKARRQEEVDKVMRALASLSGDHVVWTDGVKPTQHSAYHSPRPERSSQNVQESAKDEKLEKAELTGEPADNLMKMQNPVPADQDPVKVAAEEKPADPEPIKVVPEEKPVEKLHNPLPLPKKHVTSVMEYDYEVSDDDDYDYD